MQEGEGGGGSQERGGKKRRKPEMVRFGFGEGRRSIPRETYDAIMAAVGKHRDEHPEASFLDPGLIRSVREETELERRVITAVLNWERQKAEYSKRRRAEGTLDENDSTLHEGGLDEVGDAGEAGSAQEQ